MMMLMAGGGDNDYDVDSRWRQWRRLAEMMMLLTVRLRQWRRQEEGRMSQEEDDNEEGVIFLIFDKIYSLFLTDVN